MTALNVEQRGNPTLHDDEIGHSMRAYLVEHAEQLDAIIYKPVINKAPETFELVRLLPHRLWRVRRLLDHNDGL